MIYKIQEYREENIQNMLDRAVGELDVFYGIDWKTNKPKLFLLESRSQIDKAYGKKTEDWLVSWAENGNIFILEPDSYSKESRHTYSDDEYFKVIKHELSHLYYKILTKSYKPKWLSEGVSVYTSGQVDECPYPERFFKFLDYFDSWDGKAYKESGLFVRLLYEKYGKEKLINFIKSTSSSNKEENIEKNFNKIFGIELSYSSINKALIDSRHAYGDR